MPHSPPWAGAVDDASTGGARVDGPHTSLGAAACARAAVAPRAIRRYPRSPHALPHEFLHSQYSRPVTASTPYPTMRTAWFSTASWTMRLPILALLASSGQSHAGSS